MDVRDLGVVILSNLSAEAHVERVYLQASKTLGLLAVLLVDNSPRCTLLEFSTIVMQDD